MTVIIAKFLNVEDTKIAPNEEIWSSYTTETAPAIFGILFTAANTL